MGGTSASPGLSATPREALALPQPGLTASPPARAPAWHRSTAGRIRKRIRGRLPTPQSARTWPGAEGSWWTRPRRPSPGADLLPAGDSLGGELARWREAAGGGSASGRVAAPPTQGRGWLARGPGGGRRPRQARPSAPPPPGAVSGAGAASPPAVVRELG